MFKVRRTTTLKHPFTPERKKTHPTRFGEEAEGRGLSGDAFGDTSGRQLGNTYQVYTNLCPAVPEETLAHLH